MAAPGTRRRPPSRSTAATSASRRSTIERSSGWTIRGRRPTDPVLGAATQDALDCRALVADEPVLAQDHDAVRRVLDERPEPLLAALQVDEQQPLGRRLFLEAPVLARQDARRAAERQPDEDDEQARRDDGHDEHAGPGGVDPLLDEAGVLVDVVDADRIAIDGAADRDEQLEIVPGTAGRALADARAPGRGAPSPSTYRATPSPA